MEPLKRTLDVKKCAAWLCAEIHQGGLPACPQCGHAPSGKPARTLGAGHRIKCPACKKGFTYWSSTIFEGAKITPAEFVLMRVAIAAGLDFTGLVELTGRHGQCVSAWSTKIEAFNRNLSPGKSPGGGNTRSDDAPVAEVMDLAAEAAGVDEPGVLRPLEVNLDLLLLPTADHLPLANYQEKDLEP